MRPESLTEPMATTDQGPLDWPEPHIDQIRDHERSSYLRRKQALVAVEQGQPITETARRFGLCPKTLRKMRNSAGQSSPDGLPWGFRVCVPFLVRAGQPTWGGPSAEPPCKGTAYAFSKLLATCPKLVKALHEFKAPLLKRRSSKQFDRLMTKCERILKEYGLEGRYPLNQKDKGRRSIRRYIEKHRLSATILTAFSSGDFEPLKSLQSLFSLRPFDRVEFDAHRIDIEAHLAIEMPNGGQAMSKSVTLWLLVMIDTASRAIVAWLLIPAKAYNSLDVACCLARAITPWRRADLTIPNLRYSAAAGMPTALGTWSADLRATTIALDNALAHHAQDLKDPFVTWHGGVLNFGPAHQPELRPIVERFFKKLEEGFLRKLPGGFEPAKRLGENKIRISNFSPDDHPIQLRWLEELLDVIVANYNGTKHTAIGMPPLEYIRYHAQENALAPSAPDAELCAHEIASVSKEVTIRGRNGEVPPYIQYKYARYRTPALQNAWNLLGSRVRVKVYRNDLRSITAFIPSFAAPVTFRVGHPWSYTKHDETTRVAIHRMVGRGELTLEGTDDAVTAYVDALRSRAASSSDAATELTRMQAISREGSQPISTPRGTNDSQTRPFTEWFSFDATEPNS